jgi:uncharacterized protein (TIGR00730 family)
MGVLADAAMAAGVEVIGVIPRPLASRELAHAGLTELKLVDSMHERKATMASLADGFIALPGASAPLEETLEVLTWAAARHSRQAGGRAQHGGLLGQPDPPFGHAVAEGFVRPSSPGLMLFADEPAEALDRMAAYQPPVLPRPWLAPSQT